MLPLTLPLCADFPRGYLPMPCPSCGRRRLEYGINGGGDVIYVACEKCGANSDDDTLVTDEEPGAHR